MVILADVMVESRAQFEDGFEEEVMCILADRKGASASVDELADAPQIDSREEAQVALRRLVNEGKVSQTPDWEYKLATRLR